MSSTIRPGDGPASAAMPARRPEPTNRPPPAKLRCVHRWIEAQAARWPDAMAVSDGEQSLTYRQLNTRANRLAHRLRALGVGPEVPVGLCTSRSPEMVVALLAVLKSGGAYVPLDPDYPADRLAFMIGDARPAVLVTEEGLRGLLAATGTAVLSLDGDRERIASEPEGNLVGGAGLGNLAYVIYTSGSTGRPKGVMVPHSALARLLVAMGPILTIGPGDTLLAITTLSFDIAALELLLPLVTGARVELVDRPTATDGRGLIERLADPSITLLQATPATWRMLLEAGWAGRPELKMFCGGEAMPRALADRLLAKGAALWNVYGPTETTVWSSAGRVEPGEGPVPIGRPIAGTRLYILDRRLEPVPPGVTGELHIGGAGLARGYRGRPGLTAERFIPDPFAGRPGARVYRTGDLARWRPDGSVECLGRADHQLKIRGFRVEPGEIEAALSAHPDVRDAVVVARQHGPDDVRLVAYLVAADVAVPPTPAVLRRALKASLPDYMVPSAFVVLEALPLTPSGKVDRAALPAPDRERPAASVAFVAPRGPIEELLATIWSSVLGAVRVGAFDHFFDLGGHSLLATQVVSRIRDAFGVGLPLREFFAGPTVAEVARRIEQRMRADAGLEVPPPRRTDRDGPIPASLSQQSLWFLDQLAPGRPTFNITLAGRVRGPLDRGVLERSFAEIVRRHDALRTTFVSVDGQPFQVVAPRIDLPLTTVDLRSLDAAARESEAKRFAILEGRRPFDLARGPVVRARVLLLADDDHVILLTMHHIIGDGWSLGVAAGELTALYEAFSRGDPSPLDELPIQYADFSHWQRQMLQGEILDRLESYWRRQLADVTPLELPTDRPRPPLRTDRGAFQAFAWTGDPDDRLGELCRRVGVTRFMALLAAFQALLHRYSGQDDIVVGSPIANRNRSEIEGLIGYFVNMLALRTDLSGNPSFLDLLHRVRDVALAAYEHQDLPLEKVVESLHLPRDPSRTPLFQAMFVLQNQQVSPLVHPEISLEALDLDEGTGTAKFDLTLALAESGRGLVGGFEYSTDLFEAETIARMALHFRNLLGGILDDPGRSLSSLPLIGDEEYRRILASGTGPAPSFAERPGIHRLFELQAERTPDAIAVEAGSRRLTYRELNEHANRLARELLARGIGPGQLVAVGLLRSAELAVALLAVLKAGGAFVPLDPDYPKERLAAMLADSRAGLLLTQSSLEGRWPESGASLIRLDEAWPAISRHSAANPSGGASIADAAYVIYTSGSTGEPRGVVVPHCGLVNHNLAAASLFGLSADDRVLQFSSPSFDICIEEIFPAWIRGAAVVFREEETPLGPAEFSRWVERKRITVLDLPTVYWHAWVEGLAGLNERLPGSVRLVIVGGEKVASPRFADWCAIGGGRIRWINTYGPTEATVIATAYEPPGEARTGAGPSEIPIGRPIAGTRIYLLDGNMEPVPLGVTGEIYIGGEGVARGYLRRPGATAERFVPDPFGTTPGARLFRTGDRARWRSDGELEFLGRVDHQVKIRGFRVEPGEVEAVLQRHRAVKEAVVVARADEAGRRRLVAYVVPRGDASPDAGELRRWTQAALPEYMVPSAFAILDRLPLTPVGKLDRNALPDVGPGPLDSAAEYVAPRTPLEETIERIWAEVLGRDRVGVHDNFFDLGGHSLQSVQLVSRLSSALGRSVSVKTVFQAPSIAAMADVLEREPTTVGDVADIAALARWLLEMEPPALPEHVAIEGRPFLSLFAAGELAPVDAVAISYFPVVLMHSLGLDRRTVIHEWCEDRPVIADIRETPLGRIGTVMIPRFNDQLYLDRADLLAVLADAVVLSHRMGATTVSLTGLLPSATDYGRDLVGALAGRKLPRITTGHATTTAAVVLAVRRALEAAGRDPGGEDVGFLGLGSVGVATLRLLLSCLPHPARLSLCDVYSRREALESLRRELLDDLGYRGEVRLLASGREVPAEFYESSLIVGATNAAEVLDINHVAPGAVIVDDSAPHAFSAVDALRRFAERGDILVTEGGMLLSPEPLPVRAYVPDELEPWLRAGLTRLVADTDPRLITGCVLSGLLSSRPPRLEPTIGLVDRRTALDHYEALDALGFRAPELRLGGTVLERDVVEGFRSRYGEGNHVGRASRPATSGGVGPKA